MFVHAVAASELARDTIVLKGVNWVQYAKQTIIFKVS